VPVSPDDHLDARLDAHLGRARAKRWWVEGRRIRSVARAGAFVDDVAFALLFPSDRHPVPSLWEAVAEEDAEPFAIGMDEDEQRVWTWKDELPLRRLAWYGNFVGGRGSFVSPGLLRLLYPAYGDEGDHESLDLSPTAHQIAEALRPGPLPSRTLREIVGDRNRYQRAAAELQRSLLTTNAGTEEHAAGWPSAVIDLTCRRFDVGGEQDLVGAAAVFVDTVLACTPGELGRAFRWPVAEARRHLTALADADRVTHEGTTYRALTLTR
jgi:hypothetical protein